MIDTMLSAAVVLSFACGLFTGAIAMAAWLEGNDDDE